MKTNNSLMTDYILAQSYKAQAYEAKIEDLQEEVEDLQSQLDGLLAIIELLIAPAAPLGDGEDS